VLAWAVGATIGGRRAGVAGAAAFDNSFSHWAWTINQAMAVGSWQLVKSNLPHSGVTLLLGPKINSVPLKTWVSTPDFCRYACTAVVLSRRRPFPKSDGLISCSILARIQLAGWAAGMSHG